MVGGTTAVMKAGAISNMAKIGSLSLSWGKRESRNTTLSYSDSGTETPELTHPTILWHVLSVINTAWAKNWFLFLLIDGPVVPATRFILFHLLNPAQLPIQLPGWNEHHDEVVQNLLFIKLFVWEKQ